MLKSCLIIILGLLLTATTRESIGCEPDRILMRSFKDNRCAHESRSQRPVSSSDIRKITSGRCYEYKHGSFKGKCDLDNGKLKEVELKYYMDKACRDKDLRRLGKYESKGKLEYQY